MNKIQQNKQSKYNKKLVRESLFIEKILEKMVNDNNPKIALGQVKSLWKASRNKNKNIIEKFYYYVLISAIITASTVGTSKDGINVSGAEDQSLFGGTSAATALEWAIGTNATSPFEKKIG